MAIERTERVIELGSTIQRLRTEVERLEHDLAEAKGRLTASKSELDKLLSGQGQPSPAAVARDELTAATYVIPVEIPDAIVTQARPCSDGLSACLVAQESEREVQAQSFAAIAVFRYSHDTSYVLPGINYSFGKIFPKFN